ncbi:hypothetical protein Enr13x_77400 [Stieleria neptunia]|uniref:Uncharacterized protein n=1 Tax=Stieleria neptunia TaxID=2527979 RepID=A0A518I467_9BACT|nr:hypothetical protein [Stieleria neptunia]QDV47828.1 hypothetical protein Enr13x_77400 [Stieleria neptunia]
MSETFSDPPGSTIASAPTLYRHSGKVSPVSLVVAAAVLIPLGILFGAIYSAAVVYLPFIKLRGLVTFFVGGGFGVVAGTLCYKLKYRSRMMAFLTVIGFTAIGYYSSWAVHPALVIGPGELGGDFVPLLIQGFDPGVIIGWMKGIFTDGIWAMGAGAALSGWGAVAIWVLEAALIFGTAFVSGMAAYGNRPFCEHCHRWNDETEELAVLPVSTTDPAWMQIRNGNFDALKKLQIASDSDVAYVELRLADCPTCDESDYLSAIGITLTVDEGQLKKNETDIFRHLSVTRAQRDEIVDFAAAMAEAVQLMKEEEEALNEAADDPIDPNEPAV